MCIIIHQEAMFVNINQSGVSVKCNESAAVVQCCGRGICQFIGLLRYWANGY